MEFPTTAVSSDVVAELYALYRMSKTDMKLKTFPAAATTSGKKSRSDVISGRMVARTSITVSGAKYVTPKDNPLVTQALGSISASTPGFCQPELTQYVATKTAESYTVAILLAICKYIVETVAGVQINVVSIRNGVKSNVSTRSKVSVFMTGETADVINGVEVLKNYVSGKIETHGETTGLSPMFASLRSVNSTTPRINSTRLSTGSDKYAYVSQLGFFAGGLTQMCDKYASKYQMGYALPEFNKSLPLPTPIVVSQKRKRTEEDS